MIELRDGAEVLQFLCDPKMLEVQHVRIHPDAARAFLDLNTKNRNVTQSRVNVLVDSIRDNRWLLINNGIGIDWNGDLTDGQHRLHAVIDAGIACEFYVHKGLDPASRTVIDTGKTRSLSDTLAITGYGKGRTNLSATVRLIYRYENGLMTGTASNSINRGMLPHDMLLEYMRDELNWDLLCMVDIRGVTTARQVPGANRSAMSAAFYLMYQKDTFDAGQFDDRVRTGENLSSGDPELALRGVLARLGRSPRSSTWHFCLYLKTWNLRRMCKQAQYLAFREDEAIPDVK